ncbi:MAG: hypothetical protein PUC50_03410 [Bacteroidales bacterium]|nr:hypothetical protein [Bacteroidales bacterium]
MEQNDEEMLFKLILGLPSDDKPNQPSFAPHRRSTLQMGLQVARFLYHCSSEKTDGKLCYSIGRLRPKHKSMIPRDESFIMCSLLLYLNCLEQVGTIFGDKSNYGSDNAIELFFNQDKNNKSYKFTEEEKKAIRNLRNALAHSVGLVNVEPRNDEPIQKFLLCFNHKEILNKVAETPSEENKWHGDYKDKNPKSSVKIYVVNLIDMIETIIANAQSQYQNGDITLKRSFDEVQTRYTIRV